MNAADKAPRHALALCLIVSLFFLWGVANHLNDVLIAQFKKAFSLSDLQSGLVQSAFYLGYFLFAIPAAEFMRRYGYKRAVVFGLVLYGCGALLFYPAAELRAYAPFLGALFVIASGLAFLETSANPLMTVLGTPETAERRLNLAQAFNPLGAITGVVIGSQFILSGIELSPEQTMTAQELAAFHDREAQAVQTPYLVLGLLVLIWAAVFAATRFPSVALRGETPDAPVSYRRLLKHRNFVFGVITQFFYVGAQVGVWSFMIRYAQHAVDDLGEKTAAAYLTASLVGFMCGRFAGTALMYRIPADRLTTVFGSINLGLALFAALSDNHLGLLALATTSFFMSIMFPTVFALALKGLGPLTKPGSSFIVMAIIGGAIFPALMGLISDHSAINVAMLVPAVGFLVVAVYGHFARRLISQEPAA